MGKSSREKGKRGEREVAKMLTDSGFACRRGVQYSGGPDSPDVVGLPDIHIEVKRVERLNIENAMKQSVNDAGEFELPTVFHRKNGGEWLVTMRYSDWIDLYEYYFRNR